MSTYRKKVLSLVLALVMVFQLFPVTAFAEDEDGDEEAPRLEETIIEEKEETTAVPVGEDESKREANIKQFRMSDGTWLAATYPFGIHYEEDGTWIEIDNRLEEKEVEYTVPFPEQETKEEAEATPEDVVFEEETENENPPTEEEAAPVDDSNEEQPGEELTDGEGTPPEEETPAVEEPAAGSEEPAAGSEEPAEEEPSEEPDPAETPLAEDPTSDVTVSEGEEVIEQEEEKDEEETEPEEEKIEEDPICEKAYINLQNRFGVTGMRVCA